jgi:IMP cyclohydrolase
MDEFGKTLSSFEYPGRLILIGSPAESGGVTVVYAVTGRSPSSRARKLIRDGDSVLVRPLDDEVLKTGDPDLLIYPAVRAMPGALAVSNGKHTEDVAGRMPGKTDPVGVLNTALESWEYEPDKPTFTPRIAGCVLRGGKAALSLIRRGPEDRALKIHTEIPLIKGTCWILSTYSGRNVDPLPSFRGEPLEAAFQPGGALSAADHVYDALAPQGSGADFRVAVAAAHSPDFDLESWEITIINRCERT